MALTSLTPGGMYTALTKLISSEGALHYNDTDGCYYTDEGVRFLFEVLSVVRIANVRCLLYSIWSDKSTKARFGRPHLRI